MGGVDGEGLNRHGWTETVKRRKKKEADPVDGKRGTWEVELAPGKMVVGQQEKIKGKTVRMKM